MSTNKQQLAVAGVQRVSMLDQQNQVIMVTEGRDIILDECYAYAKKFNAKKSLKK